MPDLRKPEQFAGEFVQQSEGLFLQLTDLFLMESDMRLITFGCLVGLLGATSGEVQAQERPRRDGDLKVGAAAPAFTLQDPDGQRAVKLGDLKGKPVVLIFGSCT